MKKLILSILIMSVMLVTISGVVSAINYDRVQYAEDEGNPAQATFSSTPIEGNLLVAISFHRYSSEDPYINGETVNVGETTSDGWTLREYNFFETSVNNRRGLAVWSKIAGSSEPTVITTWSDPALQQDNRLIIQEFSTSINGDLVFVGSNSNNNGNTFGISLDTGSVSSSYEDNLVVTVLGKRDSTGGAPSWDYVGDNIGSSDHRALWSAFGESGDGIIDETASWCTSGLATSAILVFAVEEPLCEVIIDEPKESHWYDPVTIKWHYEGDCDILDQWLYYYKGTCKSDSNPIGDFIGGSGPREYEWDVSGLNDGDYCVSIYAEQHNPPSNDVEGFSGVWHLDLTDPISTISFGYPSVLVGEDYYINTNTPITITCEDEGSGPKTIFYNIYVEGGCGEWTLAHKFSGDVERKPHEVEFTCHEESRHKIEYWCVDKVGKVEEPNKEIIYVDTTAPIITKEIIGPQYGDCPPECKEDICYIDGITEIHVDAYDPKPHPVNDVYCSWGYAVNGEPVGEVYEKVLPFVIQFPEESYHELWIECWDALGNTEIDYEVFYVDKASPVIKKWYEGPYYYGSGPEEYINGETVVWFEAYDPEPHPSGLNILKYRVTLLEDENYCWNPDICSQAEGLGEWNVVKGDKHSFQIEEQSCHLIEIYAEDNVEKDFLHKQCVFVDKTAPKPIKEVGEPSHDCNGPFAFLHNCEENWDWIVTMDTEIELSCDDIGPHASGIKEICYRWYLDGELEEDWDCVSNDKVEITFNEPSEHLLEFYCVDNLDKTSETDSELFKVEGEAFTIKLLKKWNLISIPFNLISNNIEEVFDQISDEVEVVWTYDPENCEDTGWCVYTPNGGPDTLETIEPGYGYWVKMSDHEELVVGGSLLSPGPGIPPSRQLQQGWNLIGRYGLGEESAYCALFSLIDTTIGYPRWSALYSYDAEDDEFKALDTYDSTYPGEGYWIEMDVEDTYSPATACWGFW